MADVIEMIQLSPTMEEGVLVAWLKKEGDKVVTGDLIAEVETDKATMEMESFFDGTVLKLLVNPGEGARVGRALAIIGKPGEDITPLVAKLQGGAAPAAASSPAASAAPAPAPNSAPNVAPAGAAQPAETTSTASAPVSGSASPSTTPAERGRLLASPLAKKVANEKGVDIAEIAGSGPAGRVVRRDVEQFQAPAVAQPRSAAPPSGARPAPQKSAGWEVVKLSQMRKAIAKNLTAAWQAPSFTLTRSIDMAALLRLREEANAGLAAAGSQTKLSVNDFIIKACAKSLIDVPAMNSAYMGEELYLYNSADIGIAVALEGGLITPIVRNAQTKTLTEIASEARSLAARARDKKLDPSEFTGATFSISNLGMFGIDEFTAVLNPPAAGILAVGQTKKVPVVGADGQLAVGQRMLVTLTCDHRAVDGAVGATFLQKLALYLESPSLMLL